MTAATRAPQPSASPKAVNERFKIRRIIASLLLGRMARDVFFF
ncbi:MAG: hypothetical protein AB7S71_05630 [Dongiaceae bacterium]